MQPFVERRPHTGPVYHVGSREDMVALLEREHGLAWTAHPRIKASSWTPDVYHNEDFYKADFWLGAAWKAMPADLSRPRLGERALDLLDDMENWGQKKLLLGEVDVFKIDHMHELYGHMNINYVRLDQTAFPGSTRAGSPCSTLRGGRFFVTTGEVRCPSSPSAASRAARLAARPGERRRVRWTCDWTFPLSSPR